MESPNEIAAIELIRQQADKLNEASYQERNHDPALSYEKAEEALRISEEIKYIKGKGDALCNIGFYHIQLTANEKGFEMLMEALRLQEEIGNETGIANTHYNLAALQVRFANFNSALDSLQKCLTIRQKKNDKAGLALCYFQMAYINEMFGHLDEAISFSEKALEIRKILNDRIGIAALLTQMGSIYRRKKEYGKSLGLLEEALVIRSPEDEVRGYFASVYQWVELHIDMRELEKARKSAENGHDIAAKEKEWFGVMRFCQQLGKTAMLSNRWDEAKKYYDEALGIAIERKFKSITYELYELLSDLHLQREDYKQAYEYHRKFHQLKEEVLSTQSNSQLKGIQMMHQIESSKKEAELERLKNIDLKNAMTTIAEKNKEIVDSIQYASRIQRALLPSDIYIGRNLRNGPARKDNGN